MSRLKVSGFVAGLPGNAGGAFFIDRDARHGPDLDVLGEPRRPLRRRTSSRDQSRASTVEATGVELLARGAYTVVKRF